MERLCGLNKEEIRDYIGHLHSSHTIDEKDWDKERIKIVKEVIEDLEPYISIIDQSECTTPSYLSTKDNLKLLKYDINNKRAHKANRRLKDLLFVLFDGI